MNVERKKVRSDATCSTLDRNDEFMMAQNSTFVEEKQREVAGADNKQNQTLPISLPSSLVTSPILLRCWRVASNTCPGVIGIISRNAITSGVFRIRKQLGEIF